MSPEKKVDEEWKRQAQLERETDAERSGLKAQDASAAAAGGEGGSGGSAGGGDAKEHPAFRGLVESLASQALLFMGAMPDPMSGQTHRDLNQAKQMIDLLDMLEQKTKGNLAAGEADFMKQILGDVRLAYVRLSAPPPPPQPPPKGSAT